MTRARRSDPRRHAILDHAATLSDATRVRLLCALEESELTVSELCAALSIPQSTASRHLRVLGEGGFVRSRRDGTSHLYQIATLGAGATELWRLVREEVATTRDCAADRHRLERVLAARRSRSQAFFASSAGEWDELRDTLYGRHFDLGALLGLVDPGWVVGDLACGTGRVAAALAPFVLRVIAIDGSTAMLDAARSRLKGAGNVEVRDGDLERLPLPDGGLDAATMVLALHHLADPLRALAEARRALKAGGRLLVADVMPHQREDLRESMGHVWLGFSAEQMSRFLDASGFIGMRYQTLPPDPLASGPGLFVATATVGPSTRLSNDKEKHDHGQVSNPSVRRRPSRRA